MNLVDIYSQKHEELINALMVILVENCHLSLMGCDAL